MKVQIRQGVFETNSSSTHSLCIISKEDFEKFKAGELLINYSDELLPITEENTADEDNQTYEQFFNDEDLDTFVENHTTKSGDEIVVFGKYGYNG